jgi:hypothetical protein
VPLHNVVHPSASVMAWRIFRAAGAAKSLGADHVAAPARDGRPTRFHQTIDAWLGLRVYH